jgi:hypothetical protein
MAQREGPRPKVPTDPSKGTEGRSKASKGSDRPEACKGTEGRSKATKRKTLPSPDTDQPEACQGTEGRSKVNRRKTLPSSDDDDLPRSSFFLQSVRLENKRVRDAELDKAPRKLKRALTQPTRPTEKEETKRALDLERIGKQDIEAESESEEPDPGKKHKSIKIADRRNLERVSKADAIDQRLLSKYLPATIDDFLPSIVPGPDDSFVPPAWLMEASIEEVANSTVPTPLAPPIRFDLSDESVQSNSELLEASNLDLDQFLAKHQGTTLNFGSEFRPIDDLEKILGNHPNFGFFSDILANGMDYSFTEELSEDQRKAEVAAMMERGNHQSVQHNSEAVAKLLAKDVLQGFSLPVSPSLVPNLAHAMVQPAGIVKQFSLQEDGSRILKRRLTQDLSFPLTFPTAWTRTSK